MCLGRHTVTGLLCAGGRQFQDWSGDYRVFSESRFDPAAVFAVVRQGVLEALAPEAPLVAAMDDSLLRKTGRRVPEAKFTRDPLSPPFQANLAWGQRFVQISAAIPGGESGEQARMIPMDFHLAPAPKRPSPQAPQEAWQDYEAARQAARISVLGAQQARQLRESLPAKRPLWLLVDGRFTNAAMLKGLPEGMTLIGRVRGDAKLSHPPPVLDKAVKGRKRQYGESAPTPEALRKDDTVPWETVRVFAAGRWHDFRVKTLAPVLWRPAGPERPLRVIAIAPLGYRPRKGSRLLYRQPAYLIVTDPGLPIERVLQAYVWRWDIEVNFRDEKQLLGVGEAQVRSPKSARRAPAFGVAAYALLLLACVRAFGVLGKPDALPPPKWRKPNAQRRPSTMSLIQRLRGELWGKALGVPDFSGFSTARSRDVKPPNLADGAASAVLYASK